MLPLITIFLLLVISLLISLLHLTRWKFASPWLIAVFGMLLAWLLTLAIHQILPQSISYINWEPKSLFPISPTIFLDDASWVFSIALTSLGLAFVLTAVSRNEQPEPPPDQVSTNRLVPTLTRTDDTNWQSWAGAFLIISMGLVAVQAGNLMTVLLAWAAIDIVELFILLIQVRNRIGREHIVIAFSVRAVGIGMLVLAEIQMWRTGGILSLSSISPRAAIYLLLAAGLRLGVLPLHLPFLQEIPLRRGLGTILRLVPAAASLSLLVRAATVGLVNPTALYLLILSAFAALFGAILWALVSDELSGRPYWILGTASMATAAAVSGQPNSCLAWGSVSILVGGLIFFTSLRRPWLRIVALIGLLSLSGLPFTPNWAGTQFYIALGQGFPAWSSVLLTLTFVVAHALLLVGYVRHSLRSELLAGDDARDAQVERWIWLVYPIGLVILPLSHFLTSLWMLPDYLTFSYKAYLIGLAPVLLSIIIWISYHHLQSSKYTNLTFRSEKFTTTLISLSMLYRPIWYIYRQLQRLSSVAYELLEGDGGILWAIVLFLFLLMFIHR